MKNRISVQDIREENKENILTAIINNDGITRNKLSLLCRVSLMTVSNVVDNLLKDKFIYETKSKTGIGRTPSQLHYDNKRGIFLCINLTSNTCCNYTISNIHKESIITDTYTIDTNLSYKDNLKELFKVINIRAKGSKLNIIGIGVVTPGPHIKKNSIETSLINEQQDIDIRQLLIEVFHCDSIFIGHDVNMAAQAELYSVGTRKSLFYIFIGDGVGGTYVHKGKIVKGKNLQAGDIGQIITTHNNIATKTEDIVSIPGIRKLFDNQYTIVQIVEMYNNNEQLIVDKLQPIIELISRHIHNIKWLLNPDYIIIYSTCKGLSNIIIENLLSDKYIYPNSHFITTEIKASDNNCNPANIGTLNEVISQHIKRCSQCSYKYLKAKEYN